MRYRHLLLAFIAVAVDRKGFRHPSVSRPSWPNETVSARCGCFSPGRRALPLLLSRSLLVLPMLFLGDLAGLMVALRRSCHWFSGRLGKKTRGRKSQGDEKETESEFHREVV